MKKSIILLFIFISISSFSQEEQDQSFKRIKSFEGEDVLKNYELTNVNDIELQIEFIRYCNFRRYKQRLTGCLFGTSAVALGVMAVGFGDNSGVRTVCSFFSGAFAILSGAILIDSEKWLKYSSIKPSNEGIGIVIRF